MRCRSCLLALFVAVAALPLGAAEEELVVIVHPDRTERLTSIELAQIFLKKREFWAGGERILPVNRESESLERELFSSLVFDHDADELSVYWHRKYFSGVMPPATLATDRAVKEFVASKKHAIGYVRAGEVDDSVRVVLRLPTGRGGDGSP